MILQDRTTLINYELKLNDGEFYLDETISLESPEPTIKDSISGLYWKLFIDNGTIGFEQTFIPGNDLVPLIDIFTGKTLFILIYDGNVGYLLIGFRVGIKTFTRSFLSQKLSTKSFIDILTGTR